MTRLFIYRLTSDTGIAPCVENGLLSLAVCKGGQLRDGKPVHTGLRYQIGSRFKKEFHGDRVYILGIYRNKFLYLARITETLKMEEYYQGISDGRLDDIYTYDGKKYKRKNHPYNRNVHDQKDDGIRDWAGEYVLLSDDYIYLGQEAKSLDWLLEYAPVSRETKTYSGKEADKIINKCNKFRDNKLHLPNETIRVKKCGCKR